ncbi:MAG: phospholipid carrier-dependent glycosyltransferase [Cyanobacteria bacterium QS_6_48_18]|nr:MAG: phospholipid carrier-dependent glycosyltransferase [Cyanobacteria bacterium QS_6_48_18]
MVLVSKSWLTKKTRLTPFRGLLLLGIIWLAGALCDRLWFALDNSTPAWDEADYLNGVMNYWHALQTPQWLNEEWWESLWLLSSKIPPFTYISTVPFLNLFGTNADAATLVLLLYSAILLISVYGLGIQLFNVSVGLWAAGLCQLLPGLYTYRTEFLLDYPLTAIVTLSFCCLTFWKISSERVRGRGAEEQGKQGRKTRRHGDAETRRVSGHTEPRVRASSPHRVRSESVRSRRVLLGTLWRRHWGSFVQLLPGLSVSVLVFYPWYRTNWLLILTSGKRATVDSAIAEGDPALTTLDAWLYYGKILPYLLSWHLLLVPIVGLLIYLIKNYSTLIFSFLSFNSTGWLAVFLLGGYLFASVNVNKDPRYLLPLLPVLSLVLAAGLLSWKGRWKHHIRWGTVGLALLLMLFNSFPLGGNNVTQILTPRVQHQVELGQPPPHPQVISEVMETSPHLRSTLGILPSTPAINQHNFSFYGAQADFQVYGRQVGVKESQVERDARSLDWFVTKTGNQGSVPEAQAAMVKRVKQSSHFQLQDTWRLPDESTLKLHHRREASVAVQPLSQPASLVKLERVKVPNQAPPGVPVPVTYEWSGAWEQLQPGLVLLSWRQKGRGVEEEEDAVTRGSGETGTRKQGRKTRRYGDAETRRVSGHTEPRVRASSPHRVRSESVRSRTSWIHDHGIAMGRLHSGRLNPEQLNNNFQVIERTAMLPSPEIAVGSYTLEATYLNRNTGETYPITVPPITLKIDPNASVTTPPKLDLVTQLRRIATGLAQGGDALESVFAQTARINQYDPIQDYLVQAEQALEYRLQRQPQNLNWSYAIALSRVLQQDVEGAIASFQKVTNLDSQNPYSHAYLAFVYLYDWHPQAAQEALEPALALNPDLRELRTLQGVAALMQGNLIKAWQCLSTLR